MRYYAPRRRRQPPTPRPPLVEAWGHFLEARSWNLYCTLTFRADVSENWADRKFHEWVERVSTGLYAPGQLAEGRRVRWARSKERQRRGAVHYHVLLGNCEGLDAKSAEREWRRIAGDARAEPYRPRGGAAGYLAKYCADDELSEIDVGGDWREDPRPDA